MGIRRRNPTLDITNLKKKPIVCFYFPIGQTLINMTPYIWTPNNIYLSVK